MSIPLISENTQLRAELDRLRAENERLQKEVIRAENENCTTMVMNLKQENDRLRAGTASDYSIIEAVNVAPRDCDIIRLSDEIDRLRAENERLVQGWKDSNAVKNMEIHRLRAENAALREAIQFAIDSSMSYVDDDVTLEHLRAILAKTAKEGG